MGEAISKNHDRVLWDKVRNMTKTTHDLPDVMDGITGIEEISNIFANKYQSLYNSVSYNIQNMKSLKSEIESLIRVECNNPVKTITVQEVKDAISKLKLG